MFNGIFRGIYIYFLCVCVELSGLFSSSHGVVQGFRKGMWLDNLSRACSSGTPVHQACSSRRHQTQSIQPRMVVNHVNFPFSSRKTPALRHFFFFSLFCLQPSKQFNSQWKHRAGIQKIPVFLPGTNKYWSLSKFFLSPQTDLIWKKFGIQHIRHHLLCMLVITGTAQHCGHASRASEKPSRAITASQSRVRLNRLIR